MAGSYHIDSLCANIMYIINVSCNECVIVRHCVQLMLEVPPAL
jgi:hypothetical protein